MGVSDNVILIYELYFAKHGSTQYNIESKIKIQNIQVIQKKLYEVIQKNPS